MAKLSSLRTRNSTITLAESGTRLPDSPIALVATTRPSADHEVRRSERRFLLRLCGLDLRLCRQLHDPRALAGHEIVHFHNGPVGEFPAHHGAPSDFRARPGGIAPRGDRFSCGRAGLPGKPLAQRRFPCRDAGRLLPSDHRVRRSPAWKFRENSSPSASPRLVPRAKRRNAGCSHTWPYSPSICQPCDSNAGPMPGFLSSSDVGVVAVVRPIS